MSVTPCDHCNGEHGNLKCSRCRCAFYCSQECQKKHWKEHKKQCDIFTTAAAQATQKEFEALQYRDVYVESFYKECELCMGNVGEKPLVLPCGHVFCQDCTNGPFQTASFPCPRCKVPLPEGLFVYAFNNAFTFAALAYRHPEEKQIYCKLARSELSILMFQPFAVQSLLAELLYLEGKYEEAIAASKMLISIQLPFSDDVMQLRNIIKTYIALQKYTVAMDYLQEMSAITRDPHYDDHKNDIHFFFHKMSICFYHLGAYEAAIEVADFALQRNRHFENVHRYKALSQKALGRLDEAILTMRRAVRYEEPGFLRHTQRCQEELDQLLAEKQGQKQKKQNAK